MCDVDICLKWLCDELNRHKKKGTISLHLCISGGLIQCCQADHSLKFHPILYRFTTKQLEDGFTGAEWSELIQILLTRFKGTPLCKHT